MADSRPTRGRLLLFVALDLLSGGVVGALPFLLPSTSAITDGVLVVLGAAMLLAGPAMMWGGRPGRWFAAGVCLAWWAAGAVLAALLAASAGYLVGIYGAMGQALAAVAGVVMVLVMVVFWLVPGHQLSLLRRWGA